MRQVDIRILNGREYDLNAYTEEAREKADFLFWSYEQLSNEAKELKRTSKPIIENFIMVGSTNWDELSEVQAEMEMIELQLMNLAANYKNYRGISMNKIFDWLSSGIATLIFAFYFLYLAIDNYFDFHNVGFTLLSLVVSSLWFYNAYKKLKKTKKKVAI